MKYWVYKCSSTGKWGGFSGDWDDFFLDSRRWEWGSARSNSQLEKLHPGDIVLCHQSNRHRLVGLARVVRFARNTDLILKPLEELRANTTAMRKAYPRIRRIDAFRGGKIQTIYDISRAEAETLIAVARSDPTGAGRAKTAKPTSDPAKLESEVRTLLTRKAIPKPDGVLHPEKVGAGAKAVFKRSAVVKAWVLKEAKGSCELCASRAPFRTSDGSPFLETHHVRELATGGSDTVENSVAVCPNCHRALHHSRERAKLRRRVYARVARLEEE